MSDDIINITRNIWRTFFPDNKEAPKTLCYDPLSLFTGTHYGLCHIAHDSIYMDRAGSNYDPDNQIFTIDPYDRATYPAGPQDLTTADVPNLPQLECVLFVSCDKVANTELVLEKLMSTGIAIIINDCVTLPNEWIPLQIPTGTPFGKTTSFKPDGNVESNKLKSITAFRKP